MTDLLGQAEGRAGWKAHRRHLLPAADAKAPPCLALPRRPPPEGGPAHSKHLPNEPNRAVSETLLMVCSHPAAGGAGEARAGRSPQSWVVFHHEDAFEGAAVAQSVLVSSGSTVALRSRTHNGPSPSKPCSAPLQSLHFHFPRPPALPAGDRPGRGLIRPLMKTGSRDPWAGFKEISINCDSFAKTTTPLCSRLSAKEAFIMS